MKRLGPDAFARYLALGPGRSLAAIAEVYGVSKRAVVNRSRREGWAERIKAIEAKEAEQAEAEAIDALAEMKQRHLKLIEAVQGKAVQTLRAMPLSSAYQAVRALVAAIEQERIARGEPSERTAIDLETVIRREYEQVFTKPGKADDWNFDAHADGAG